MTSIALRLRQRKPVTMAPLLCGVVAALLVADVVAARAALDITLLAFAVAAAASAVVLLRPVYAIDAWIVLVPLTAWVRIDPPGLPAITAARAAAFFGVVAAISAIATGRRAATAYLALPALVFVLAATASYVFRPLSAPTDASSFLDTILVPLAAAAPFLVVRAARADLKRHVVEMGLVGSLIGVATIYEHVGERNPFHSATFASDVVYRATGPFEHPIVLAALLAFTLVVLFEAAHQVHSLSARAVAVAAIGLVSAAAFFTYSRGPLIAAGLAIVFLMLRGRRIARMRAEITVLMAALAFAAYHALQNASVIARVTNVETIDTRLSLYHLAWRLFREHPLLGVGVRGFGHAVAYELPPALNGVANWSAVDNAYLQALVESGVFGAAALLAIVILSVRAVARAQRNDLLERVGSGLVVAAVLMAFGFDAFDFPLVTAALFMGLRLVGDRDRVAA